MFRVFKATQSARGRSVGVILIRVTFEKLCVRHYASSGHYGEKNHSRVWLRGANERNTNLGQSLLELWGIHCTILHYHVRDSNRNISICRLVFNSSPMDNTSENNNFLVMSAKEVRLQMARTAYREDNV